MYGTMLAFSLVLAITSAGAAEPKATLAGDDPALAAGTRVTPVAITSPVDADGNLRVVEQSTQPKQVEVVNFPATQVVSGAVEVTNPCTPTRPYRLIGFTVATVGTHQGYFSLLRACQNEFPGSRVCQLEEVLTTTEIPAISPGATRYAHLVKSFTNTGYPYEDCHGWAAEGSSYSGWLVSADGHFDLTSCGVNRSVACCAP